MIITLPFQALKRLTFSTLLLAFLWTITGCSTSQKAVSTNPDIIDIQIIQLNDVYEITPLGDDKGGMARVATLKKALKQKNSNTIAVLSGDFVSPSAIGTLKYDGASIRGKQMIEVMNAAGIDYVTFGNHEFDIKEAEIQSRIDESTFEWIASNVSHVTKTGTVPFTQRGTPLPRYKIVEFKNASGAAVKVGIIGVTLPANKQDFVAYEDFFAVAKRIEQQISSQVDFTIALTHIDVADDIKLAAMMPQVPLLLGGHDHTHMYIKKGSNVVAKADANAKTVYVHTLSYNKSSKKVSLKSKLTEINNTIPDDPATLKVVNKWVEIARTSLKAMGFNADEKVMVLKTPLDARETVVRYKPSYAAELVTKAMSAATSSSECTILNCGSIRIDDIVTGAISQYDVIRILPFGGKIALVEMKGSLLNKIIKIGAVDNVGNGGYLGYDRCAYDKAKGLALVGGMPIDPAKTYKVALPEFLLTGKEYNLGFLTKDNPEISKVTLPDKAEDPMMDIRVALIKYMKTL